MKHTGSQLAWQEAETADEYKQHHKETFLLLCAVCAGVCVLRVGGLECLCI